VNIDTCDVRELKPKNRRAIRLGQKQVEQYQMELEEKFGRPFTSAVDVYE
jgi:hypothetical protein